MDMIPRCSSAVLATLMLLLAGCASKPSAPPPPPAQVDAQRRSEFDMSLDKWHGATLAEVLTKLGKPSKITRQADGSPVYSFTKATAANPGTGRPGFSCTVSYVIDEKTQRVRNHHIEGC